MTAHTSAAAASASSRFPMVQANAMMLEDELSKHAYADTSGGREKGYSQPFTDVFERELCRIVKAINQYQTELEFSLKSLLTSAESVTDQIKRGRSSDGHGNLGELSKKMHDFVDSCINLQNATTNSRQAMLYIAQKADNQTKSTKKQFTELVQSSFPATLNSILVVVASDIYALIRSAEKKLKAGPGGTTGDDDGVWKAPSSFQRTTTKYWVKEEQLTKLLLTCAGEAPLLVYGKKGTLTPKMSRLGLMSDGDKLWSSMVTPITSVYFDSPDMSMYKKRLARIEGAQLLRARWYGNKMPKGDGIIFLELKTHHEKWVSNKSVKERAAVQERDMTNFLQPVPWTTQQARDMIIRASPNLSSDELTKSTNLLLRMHMLVVKNKLQSCVRSVYMRAAFQSAKSNDIRLTVDRKVTLVDETSRDDTLGKSWCLSEDEAKNRAKAVVVPFEVFEVKLVGDNPMPHGLAALIDAGVIEEAPKFSKFLSGAAAFNQHSINKLPYWANHPAFAAMFGMQGSRSNTNARDYTSSMDPCDCYQLFGGDATSCNQSSGVVRRSPLQVLLKPMNDRSAEMRSNKMDVAPKNPVRVEPKSYFANERTFIQWISAALLLLTVATILMSNGQFMRTAAMIAFSALFLVVYSAFVYFRRINLLSSGEGYGYIDKLGPAILAAAVGFGIFTILVDMISGSDMLGERQGGSFFGNDERRLESWKPRRLISDSQSETSSIIYEDPGTCVRRPLLGINPLTFEPNDAIVNTEKHSLLVVSTAEILAHPLDRGATLHLTHLDNTELGGLARFGSHIFALSGGPVRSELLSFTWTESGSLEQQGRWILSDSVSEINGLAVIGEDEDEKLYIGMNGSVNSYRIPDADDASLSRVDSINMKMINQGLVAEDAITSFHEFEGITYFMHAPSGVLHAWDLSTGEFLAEIPLPRLDIFLANEWKGFAFERRVHEGRMTSLRGNNKTPESNMYLHLTTHSPPQIWTFAIDEVKERGDFKFPSCAAVAISGQN